MGSALKEWMVPWSSLERVAVSPGLVVREMAVPRDGGAASLSLPVRWPRMGSWLSFFSPACACTCSQLFAGHLSGHFPNPARRVVVRIRLWCLLDCALCGFM